MLRVLSIGNSFSQDAQHYLSAVAKANGVQLKCVNLYIGGCSLKQHWENAEHHSREYAFETNGGRAWWHSSLRRALSGDKWDVVTLQQASHDSGKYATYQPYLTELSAFVYRYAPEARQVLHQTWAYELDSTHPAFADYGSDQAQMFFDVRNAYHRAAAEMRMDLIPVGDVIQALRARQPFDYAHGGISLCRDGFHLSFDYGRYAAAVTWLAHLAGINVRWNGFLPEGCTEADGTVLRMICRVASEIGRE